MKVGSLVRLDSPWLMMSECGLGVVIKTRGDPARRQAQVYWLSGEAQWLFIEDLEEVMT